MTLCIVYQVNITMILHNSDILQSVLRNKNLVTHNSQNYHQSLSKFIEFPLNLLQMLTFPQPPKTPYSNQNVVQVLDSNLGPTKTCPLVHEVAKSYLFNSSNPNYREALSRILFGLEIYSIEIFLNSSLQCHYEPTMKKKNRQTIAYQFSYEALSSPQKQL